MLDVSSKVVQEHNIKENSHYLRQRRISVIGRFLLVLQIVAADTDRENLLRPQPYDRAERLLKTQTSIAEEGRPSGGFESHRLKDQGYRSRRANVVDGN